MCENVLLLLEAPTITSFNSSFFLQWSTSNLVAEDENVEYMCNECVLLYINIESHNSPRFDRALSKPNHVAISIMESFYNFVSSSVSVL